MNKEERRNHFAAIALAQLLIPENFAGVLEGATAKKMDLNKAMALTCVDLADALLAELDRTKPEPEMPQPDADGWIPHKPGDPAPCKDETKVFVKYADGYYSTHYTHSRKSTWELFNLPILDVIAWKPA